MLILYLLGTGIIQYHVPMWNMDSSWQRKHNRLRQIEKKQWTKTWRLCLKILRDVDHSDIISLAQEALTDCMTSDLAGMTVKSLYFLWPSVDWCTGTCPSFEFQDKGTAARVHVDCASPLFQQPGQVFARSPVDGCASNLDKTIPLRPLNPEVGNLEEHLSDVDIKSYLWV